MMYGDLHYEVVLNPRGEHRIYFSDAQRAELPASVTSDVTIAVITKKACPNPCRRKSTRPGASG
jgi:hypothetical protein